jgi:hypothetical protein
MSSATITSWRNNWVEDPLYSNERAFILDSYETAMNTWLNEKNVTAQYIHVVAYVKYNTPTFHGTAYIATTECVYKLLFENTTGKIKLEYDHVFYRPASVAVMQQVLNMFRNINNNFLTKGGPYKKMALYKLYASNVDETLEVFDGTFTYIKVITKPAPKNRRSVRECFRAFAERVSVQIWGR